MSQPYTCMHNSLYAQYVKERGGKELIETEHSFATYYILEQGCYIEDVFVQPEYRSTGIARETVDWIARIAKQAGCTKMYCTVCPSALNSTDSLKAVLAVGFMLSSVQPNLIVFKKDL